MADEINENEKEHPSVTIDMRSLESIDDDTQLVVVYLWPDTEEGTRGLSEKEFEDMCEAFADRWPTLGYAVHGPIPIFVFEIASSIQAGALIGTVYGALMDRKVYAPWVR